MGNWAFIGEQIGSLMGANYLRRGYDKSLAKTAERLRSEGGATEADKEKAYQNIMTNYGFTGLDGKSFGKEIEASKLGYDAAKAQGSQAGMDMYHNRANMLREIGKSQGWDMTGLGAGDTLESVQGILSQAAGAAPTSLGNSNPQSMLFGDMSLNAAVNNMYSKPTLGGALGSMPGQFFPMESAPPKMTLTEDMLKNYFMSSGTVDKEAAAFAEARRNDPRYLDQLEIDLISQGLDANAVRTVIGKEKQQRQEAELKKIIDDMYASEDPRIANKYAISLIAQGRPDLAAYYTQTNATPFYDRQISDRLGIMNRGYELGKQTGRDKLDNTIALSNHSAGLQVDTAGRIGALQLELGKLSFEQKIQLAQQYPAYKEFIFGVKPKAMPKYADVLDKKFAIAEQAIGGGDVDISGKAIDELKIEIEANKNKMDQEDYDAANMRVMALLALREYKAGYIDQAREYAKSLPESMRKAYGLIFDDKPAARAPREAQEQPKEKLGDKIRRQREAGMWVNPYTGTAYNGNPWFGTKPD